MANGPIAPPIVFTGRRSHAVDNPPNPDAVAADMERRIAAREPFHGPPEQPNSLRMTIFVPRPMFDQIRLGQMNRIHIAATDLPDLGPTITFLCRELPDAICVREIDESSLSQDEAGAYGVSLGRGTSRPVLA